MSSSGSESDDDYVPGEPEKVSEEESANEETDLQFEKELDQKAKKRKIVKETKGTKKRRTRNGGSEDEEPPEKAEEIEEIANPEEQKKKEDDLWAMFLEGTDSKAKPTSTVTSSSIDTTKPVSKTETAKKDVPKSDDQAREKRIFEFAGETIVVENNTIKEKVKTADSPATVSNLVGPSHGRPSLGGGGLSSVLGQLNKKNKLSTLEKSKLDWSTYKQDEGLEEEIQSHNKGRNGYLDKRDFLERADVRQYEIERDMRLTRRSNR